MRRFAPIVALTFVASTTFFAGAARADEEVQVLAPTPPPAEAPPAQVPQPLPSPSTQRSALKRPTTIGEFDTAKRALNERLRSIRANGGKGSDEEEQARDDLRTLERWFDEDTEMASTPAVVGGVVLMSVGGTAAALGGICLASAAFFHKGSSDVAPCAGVTVGGLVGGLVGLAFLVSGSPRVVKPKAQATTSLFAPSARLLVGPGTVGVGGTF